MIDYEKGYGVWCCRKTLITCKPPNRPPREQETMLKEFDENLWQIAVVTYYDDGKMVFRSVDWEEMVV